MKIVYMGTPDFAVAPLEALIDAGHEIIAVFTQPDRPKNRGMKMTFSPVKECAVKHNIPVYQPETFREGSQKELLKELAPELIVVAAYGRLLPGYALRSAKHGCINIHASLLPKYRGSAPIQWSVINGEEKTGVTTMYMARELDTGDMIEQAEYVIKDTDTAEDVHDRLAELGAKLIISTIELLEKGELVRTPQDHDKATLAPMLKKEDAQIDWNRDSRSIINLVRGTYPWPGAYTKCGSDTYKLFNVRKYDADKAYDPGTIICSCKEGIAVACGNGEAVIIEQIQAPGSRRMNAADYCRGHALPERFDIK